MKTLLFGPLLFLLAFAVLAAAAVVFMTDVGVNIMLAIIEAVTPPPSG